MSKKMPHEPSLVFPVVRLDEGENRFEVDVAPAELDLPSYQFVHDVRCTIVLTKTRERVDAQLDVSSTVRLECSRCQESTDYDIQSSTRLTFFPEDKTRDSDEDTTDLEFYAEEIDLCGVVRDCFILSVPIVVVCRDDCKGLCPTCGINLNRGSCDCGENNTTSPFKDLRRLVDG